MVRVGDYLTVALDTDFDWSNVKASDPTIVRAATGAQPPSGAQGEFVAVRPGETTLSATGTVHCDLGVSCPQLARLFRVTIRVLSTP